MLQFCVQLGQHGLIAFLHLSLIHIEMCIRDRDGKFVEIPKTGTEIEGKMTYKSTIKLQENDFLFTMSDGTIHAGVGKSLNFGWERKDIINFLEMMYDQSYTCLLYTSVRDRSG